MHKELHSFNLNRTRRGMTAQQTRYSNGNIGKKGNVAGKKQNRWGACPRWKHSRNYLWTCWITELNNTMNPVKQDLKSYKRYKIIRWDFKRFQSKGNTLRSFKKQDWGHHNILEVRNNRDATEKSNYRQGRLAGIGPGKRTGGSKGESRLEHMRATEDKEGPTWSGALRMRDLMSERGEMRSDREILRKTVQTLEQKGIGKKQHVHTDVQLYPGEDIELGGKTKTSQTFRQKKPTRGKSPVSQTQ